MQNFELLKEAGKSGIPVLLKRGIAATVDEWLNAAEYIISEGNPNIVLCERGIRTYETSTRNTLDISACLLYTSLSDALSAPAVGAEGKGFAVLGRKAL